MLCVISGTFELSHAAFQILTGTLFALTDYLIAVRMQDMGHVPVILIPP